MPKLKTQSEFLAQARSVHKDKYDYTEVQYKATQSHVIIICATHGRFSQTPLSHIQGQGCKQCGFEKLSLDRRYSKEQFLEMLATRTKNFTDFFLEDKDYVNARQRYKITCKKCNLNFLGLAGSLLSRGIRCPKCLCSQKSLRSRDKREKQFLSRAKLKFGAKFNYSEIQYITAKNKVKIVCAKHGATWQTPDRHLLSVTGCPKCRYSSGEIKIAKILEGLKIKYIGQYWFKECRRIRPLRFDFYLPKYDILIEYDGLQHFVYVPTYKMSLKSFLYMQENDKIKNDFCLLNRKKLLRFTYKDTDDAIEQQIKQICQKP